MLKKTVTYEDFNGNEVTEDLYFHLNSIEVTRLTAKFGGDLEGAINRLVARRNLEEMMEFMEQMILLSYGVKSDDGRSFIKSKEVKEAFEYSQAYAELFETLILNPEEAKKFGEGIVMTNKIQAKLDEHNLKVVDQKEPNN